MFRRGVQVFPKPGYNRKFGLPHPAETTSSSGEDDLTIPSTSSEGSTSVDDLISMSDLGGEDASKSKDKSGPNDLDEPWPYEFRVGLQKQRSRCY